MFRTAIRVARPVVARSTFRPAQTTSLRALHASARVASGGPAPPSLYGSGGKPGEVPTDVDQATGLERLQLLGELEGVEIFDEKPLDASRIGTKANPILVPSYDVERIVGCTGYPADSHDVHWFNLTKEKHARCSECGSVYALDVMSGNTVADNTAAHTH